MGHFARSIRVLLAGAVLGLVAGCTTGDDTTDDPQISELLEEAEALQSGDGEVPYGACEWYGDCLYCENSRWRYGEQCSTVCYLYICPGDHGSGCYDDCGLRA